MCQIDVNTVWLLLGNPPVFNFITQLQEMVVRKYSTLHFLLFNLCSLEVRDGTVLRALTLSRGIQILSTKLVLDKRHRYLDVTRFQPKPPGWSVRWFGLIIFRPTPSSCEAFRRSTDHKKIAIKNNIFALDLIFKWTIGESIFRCFRFGREQRMGLSPDDGATTNWRTDSTSHPLSLLGDQKEVSNFGM